MELKQLKYFLAAADSLQFSTGRRDALRFLADSELTDRGTGTGIGDWSCLPGIADGSI